MLHHIPKAFLERMQHLEEVDARDRRDGTPHSRRLRQISRETGQFLAIVAAGVPDGIFLEIGTSAGYSTLWLALACLDTHRTIITAEVSEEKIELARETFRQAGLGQKVRCVHGDARDCIENYEGIALCFLDADKEVYLDCYEAAIPRMVKGGLFIADNVISHRQILQPFVERALRDERVYGTVVPIGSGELLCRKI